MRSSFWFGLTVVVAGALAEACGSGSEGTRVIVLPNMSPTSSATENVDGGAPPVGTDSGTTVPTGDGGGGATGLPCNVSTVLGACIACHSDPPIAGSLAGLVTIADLKATSHLDATKTEAEESVALMTAGASTPMPPGGPVPAAADVSTLQSWITAGYPMGASCGGGTDGGAPPPPANSVFNGAPPFMLGQTSDGKHNAGQDCVGCHAMSGGEAPPFTFAGTVYDSTGAGLGDVEVRLIDANGQVISLYSSPGGGGGGGGSSTGNFGTTKSWVAPARVGIRNATTSADMLVPLQSGQGGCNACHCSGGSSCTTTKVTLP
jgi:hypothetical protein